MLVVRKEGKAHDQYNSFRSAFELMEAVGREPSDNFNGVTDDLPPLAMLEKRMMMQHKTLFAEIQEVKAENSQLKSENIEQHKALLAEIHEVKAENSQLKSEISQLKSENIDLRCRLEKLEHRT